MHLHFQRLRLRTLACFKACCINAAAMSQTLNKMHNCHNSAISVHAVNIRAVHLHRCQTAQHQQDTDSRLSVLPVLRWQLNHHMVPVFDPNNCKRHARRIGFDS